MIDVNKLLTAVLTGAQPPRPGGMVQPYRGAPPGFAGAPRGGLGAGALAGGLAGVLLSSKQARKLAGGAMQVGAAALLGGLAYKAYTNYRAGKPVIPQNVGDLLGGLLGGQSGTPPSSGGFLSGGTPPADSGATLLLRAMIASAMSDGRLDEAERALLIERVEASGLTGEEKRYLESLIARPDTPAQLAMEAKTPEAAAQVYLAAFIAIDADTPAETAWLDDLAGKLGLDPALRANIESAGRASA